MTENVTPEPRDFEDLTLAELLREFIRAPRQTWRSLSIVTAPIKQQPIAAPRLVVTTEPKAASRQGAGEEAGTVIRATIRLLLYLAAVGLAWWANYEMVATPEGQRFGLPEERFLWFRLLVAFLLVIFAEVVGNYAQLQVWIKHRGKAETRERIPQPAVETSGVRLLLLLPMILLSLLAYFTNVGTDPFGNPQIRFTLIGTSAWLGSILLAIFAFAPRDWNLFASIRDTFVRITTFPRNEPTTFLSLLLIMAVASFIRLEHIDAMLPEMTSDHVEKLLDAQGISNGEYRIFMEENGGREVAHFYLLALIDQIPGVDLDFMALKILAALEGILTIPVFWWLGREIIGERDRRFGNIVGITFALVASVAFWHIQLSRIALRIVLTPLVASLLLIYLFRGVRYNRRADFIKAGLVLGFGLYTYQAVRMMPLLVIALAMAALIFNTGIWRLKRPNWRLSRAYFVNYVVLVMVAFVVFVPLFRYSVQHPEAFWSRATGRLLGEDRVMTTNELGQTVTRFATAADRMEALQKNVGILQQNMGNALLMFNYRGDIIFLHNAPKYPHLDPLLGALLIVGSAGWLVWMIRYREGVDWFIPVGILIMLLPSALAIAAPSENPSATRASGALPLVLFLVSFGAATIYNIVAKLPATVWRLVPAVLIALVMVLSNLHSLLLAVVAVFAYLVVVFLLPEYFRRASALAMSAMLIVLPVYRTVSWVMFEPYRIVYFQSWHPISMAGDIMRGFSQSGGAYGNTWVLSYKYWWDYRAIAIEAGLKPGTWGNGDIAIDELPKRMLDAKTRLNLYPLDVNKDLLIFYHRDDTEAEARLRAWFPQGYSTLYEVYLPELEADAAGKGLRFPDKDFRTYRVPALGEEGFNRFIAGVGVQ
jgi:hypothetical protein